MELRWGQLVATTSFVWRCHCKEAEPDALEAIGQDVQEKNADKSSGASVMREMRASCGILQGKVT